MKYTMVFGNPDKAIETLGRIGDRQVVMELSMLLPKGNTLLDATAQAAFIALARIGAIDELQRWFKNRQEIPQRSALRLIRSLNEPLMVRLLMEVPTFEYHFSKLDEEIIVSLAQAGSSAVQLLGGYLSASNFYAGRIAALALGKMKHLQARDLLRQRVNDPGLSPGIQGVIRELLE
ncbi:MAG: hypothetical protein HPY85_03670 [Anaerolineae bacterium]|nr:hypothetical protein [Anaerolineae bacterium]